MAIQETQPNSIIEEAQQIASLSQLAYKYRLDGSHDRLSEDETEPFDSLDSLIGYFDTNWQDEGLPWDWYDLKKRVGFSMDSQMRLLQGTDYESVALWAQQTKKDVLAFCLEYLSQGLVFPFQYEKTYTGDGQWQYVDKKYQKTMLSMVTEKERNGAVVRSLSAIQDFFLDFDTPDGSMAIMPSPKGPSGLTTDDGRPIIYPDSYWFVMVKDGDKMKGCTIKTDLSVKQSRIAIALLSDFDIQLSQEEPLEAYNESVIFIDPRYEYSTHSTQDILRKLQQAKDGSPFAFEERTWDDIARDMQRGDELYYFNELTQGIVAEFTDYVTWGNFSELELRKALAATILRLSKLFLFDEVKTDQYPSATGNEQIDSDLKKMAYVSYGHVLGEVEKIPGCAGGGFDLGNSSFTIISSLVPRVGQVGLDGIEDYLNDPNLCRCKNQSPHFHCPGQKRKKELRRRVDYKKEDREGKGKNKKDGNDDKEEEPCLEAIVVGQGITACLTCGEGKKC